MPKNVDHDIYRLELAQKAALLFSKRGYTGLGMRDIASDKSRQLARDNYLNLISNIVGKNDSTPVLCLMFGTLLIRFLDGSTTDYEEVEDWLIEALQNGLDSSKR